MIINKHAGSRINIESNATDSRMQKCSNRFILLDKGEVEVEEEEEEEEDAVLDTREEVTMEGEECMKRRKLRERIDAM